MRTKLVATVIALGTLVALPAFADPSQGHGKGQRPNFPVAAAEFQQHVTARQAKMREHMEARASKLPASEATALRAKFDADIAKVNAEVAKAVADGTVTKEEAAAVRAASPHGGHGKGGCDKGKKA
jgi:hypothetical protein